MTILVAGGTGTFGSQVVNRLVARGLSVRVLDSPCRAHLGGRIVGDVVAGWARIHRMPVALTLDGPSGGRFLQGSHGEERRLDAVKFCRVVWCPGTEFEPIEPSGVVLMYSPIVRRDAPARLRHVVHRPRKRRSI